MHHLIRNAENKKPDHTQKNTGGSGSLPAGGLPVPFLCIYLFFPLFLLCVLLFSRFISRPDESRLTRVDFPAAFAAFAGYTPDQEEALWKEVEDSEKRYTLLERNEDGSLSLYVTPSQLRYNRRIYEEGLKGWRIRCESNGVTALPSSDYRSVSLIAGSYDEYMRSFGEWRAVLVAVSCLQILQNKPDDEWRLHVQICQASSPDEVAKVIASCTLPGEEPFIAPDMWFNR